MRLGNGDGTFAALNSYSTGASTAPLALGDVNGDSRLDLIASNVGANSVSVLLGNGDGTFATKTDYATGSGQQAVTVADVDNDSKPDIVTTNISSMSAAVLLNTTAIAFTQNGDTLYITPPAASTVGRVQSYQIQYTTQARLNAGQRWAIWASAWPADALTINLDTTQSLIGCQARAASPATKCYRAIGEQGPGSSFIYRITARYSPSVGADANTPFTPTTTVTRTGTP